MKNFVIGSVIALATAAAGCTSDSGCPDGYVDDGTGTCVLVTSDYATISATWTVRTIDNPSIPCPPNGQTAAVFAQRVDAQGNLVGTCAGRNNISNDCFVDLYDCEDHAGSSDPLPPATYLVWISLTDDTGNIVYAQSTSAYLDVSNVDLTFNASIYDDGGYFSASWALEGDSSGDPLTCSEAGASYVSATVSSGAQMFDTNPWACDDYYGVTSVIPEAASAYSVTLEALDSGMLSLTTNTAGSTYQNQTISGPNKVTALPDTTILIDSL